MPSIKSAALAAALTATLAFSSAVPAQAQGFSINIGQRDRVVTEFCTRNSRLDDCQSYRRGGWKKGDYDRFYSRHRIGLDQLAFGLFGLTFAGIVGAAIANERNNDRYYDDFDDRDYRPRRGLRMSEREWQAHVDRCYANYRSYDERTDTFQPYGKVPRKRCAL